MTVNRCPHCMEELGELNGNFCPFCGFNAAQNPQPPEALPRESILHGKYLIGDVLGRGGFGITYIGFDLALEMKVAIKEYYPSGAVSRRQGETSLLWNSSAVSSAGRQNAYNDFLKEARKMARIDQIPSVVRVRETFLENETAYIIMDYVEGETLKTRLRRDGVLTYSACYAMLRPMMEDLQKVHQLGIIHLDISPDNIMIQKDGSVKLLDLGAAKDLNKKSNGMSQLVTKNGFSPAEQYMESGKIGPWTDVYALCATIYYACYGKLVPQALERMMDDALTFDLPAKEPLPQYAVEALKKGLAVRVNDRVQNVEELLSLLEKPKATEPDRKPKTTMEPKPESKTESIRKAEPETKEKGKRTVKFGRKKFIAVGLSLVLVAVLGVYYNYVPRVVTEKAYTVANGESGTYSGDWAGGKPNGQGKLLCENGDIYEGDFENGVLNGHGKITWAKGDVFEGSFENGIQSGQGEMTYKNGDSYDGEWKNGKRDGQGLMIYKNGNYEYYEGAWEDDMRNGQGKTLYVNGNIYEGDWKNDQLTGQGKYTWNDGDTYEGGFENGMLNGYGEYVWEDGRVYKGYWKDDDKSGIGRMEWPSGAVYEGDWENDNPNGLGTMVYDNGNMYDGSWKDGEKCGQGTYTWPDGEVYEGEFANDVRNGQGKDVYADGTVYEGSFADDERNGQGKMVYASGTVYEGGWKDGQYSGQGTYTWTNGMVYKGSFANGVRHGKGTMIFSDGSTLSGTWTNDTFVR